MRTYSSLISCLLLTLILTHCAQEPPLASHTGVLTFISHEGEQHKQRIQWDHYLNRDTLTIKNSAHITLAQVNISENQIRYTDPTQTLKLPPFPDTLAWAEDLPVTELIDAMTTQTPYHDITDQWTIDIESDHIQATIPIGSVSIRWKT